MKKTILLWLLMTLFVVCGQISAQTADVVSPQYSLSDSIINFGKNYLKTRYRAGGMSESGFDCSGFTSFVYKKFGYSLPRSSSGQGAKYLGIDRKDMQRGDLVFFNGRKSRGSSVGHVGIITDVNSDGTFDFIHASTTRGVVVSSSQETYYVNRYVGAGRVIGGATSTPIEKQETIEKQEVIAATAFEEKIINTEYIVRKGETLADISKIYDISVDELVRANNLKSNKTYANQKLIIPYKTLVFVAEKETKPVNQQSEKMPPAENILNAMETAFVETNKNPQPITFKNPKFHTVQAGETLYSISRENQISVAQITDYNQLASNEIKVGQMLIVGETPEEVSETTISEIVETPILTENQKSPEKQTHTVQKGDTLYSISRNYGCTVSDLKEWNQKTDNALKIGENIVIFVK